MSPTRSGSSASLLFAGVFSLLGLTIAAYWRLLRLTTLYTGVIGAVFGNAQEVLKPAPEALNPKLQNTILNETLTLHYNGSGPVPEYDKSSPDPEAISPLSSTSGIEDAFFIELLGVANSSALLDDCSRCVAFMEMMHLAAITQPVPTVTNLLIRTCNALPSYRRIIYAETCESEFDGTGRLGPYLAQLFSKMNIATGDMQALCHYHYQECNPPETMEIIESDWFDPKPESAEIAPEASGETLTVLHLSDWHLDPRYDIGSEANCTDYQCCRPYSTNDELYTNSRNASIPASRFGSFDCDSPADLALSAFSSMPDFFPISSLAFTIFTGDIVSHDRDDHLSRDYASYSEEVTFHVFKTMLGDSPVYATLGNHDTLPIAFNPPHNLNPDPTNTSTNALAWNYDLLSSLWSSYGWLNETESTQARTNYGAYAATTSHGLRIISINTDFWYQKNIFAFANYSNPDTSGMLSFLITELTACELRNQRAWIIGHVLSGYDGSQPLPNPTALFYSIIRRFSPSTIAGIFFGHTHEDQIQLFYDFLPNSTRPDPITGKTLRNTSLVDYTAPLNVAYIGSSITPLSNLNAGYQLYSIDSRTFQIMNKTTYIANISNSLSWHEPIWEVEYSTRFTYDPEDKYEGKPLDAHFWHVVTERMLRNEDGGWEVAQMYNLFERKSSVKTQACDNKECAETKVCWMRSGSADLGRRCPGWTRY